MLGGILVDSVSIANSCDGGAFAFSAVIQSACSEQGKACYVLTTFPDYDPTILSTRAYGTFRRYQV